MFDFNFSCTDHCKSFKEWTPIYYSRVDVLVCMYERITVWMPVCTLVLKLLQSLYFFPCTSSSNLFSIFPFIPCTIPFSALLHFLLHSTLPASSLSFLPSRPNCPSFPSLILFHHLTSLLPTSLVYPSLSFSSYSNLSSSSSSSRRLSFGASRDPSSSRKEGEPTSNSTF